VGLFSNLIDLKPFDAQVFFSSGVSSGIGGHGEKCFPALSIVIPTAAEVHPNGFSICFE
jgi:hypothetical protein